MPSVPPGDQPGLRSGLGKTAIQAFDEPVCFIQFAPQVTRKGIGASGAARTCASTALVGGFELLGDLGNALVERNQKLSCLAYSGVVAHVRILSPILNVRALGSGPARAVS
jgi:hypothetical protein